jgi:hypothetical protein
MMKRQLLFTAAALAAASFFGATPAGAVDAVKIGIITAQLQWPMVGWTK